MLVVEQSIANLDEGTIKRRSKGMVIEVGGHSAANHIVRIYVYSPGVFADFIRRQQEALSDWNDELREEGDMSSEAAREDYEREKWEESHAD